MVIISISILTLALDRGTAENHGSRSFLFSVCTAFLIAVNTLIDSLGVPVPVSSLGYIL
jgi:hypothetical protein